jgi:Skp family chaperone for outer membrane proteins
MKFLISSAFLLLMFSASASEMTTTNASKEATQTVLSEYPGPGKGARKNKRINKKRKRKCSKWGRKSFAG